MLGLTARQEAKGDAIDVYTLLESQGMAGIAAKFPIVEQLKKDMKHSGSS